MICLLGTVSVMIVRIEKKGEIYPPYLILIMKSQFDALNTFRLAGVDDPLTQRISLFVDEVVQSRKVDVVVKILGTVFVLYQCLIVTSVNTQVSNAGRFNVRNLKEHCVS